MKVIYLGAGEFWLLEAVYQNVKGVFEVVPGYMGGEVPYPTHDVVMHGMTGHVEVVQIVYDETIVPLENLLALFYALHDPTVPNHPMKGAGSQYRPVIFYTNEEEGEPDGAQSGQAVGVIQQYINGVQDTLSNDKQVTTEVRFAQQFYPADESHYNYYVQHPNDAYTSTIIEPKLSEIKERFDYLF